MIWIYMKLNIGRGLVWDPCENQGDPLKIVFFWAKIEAWRENKHLYAFQNAKLGIYNLFVIIPKLSLNKLFENLFGYIFLQGWWKCWVTRPFSIINMLISGQMRFIWNGVATTHILYEVSLRKQSLRGDAIYQEKKNLRY